MNKKELRKLAESNGIDVLEESLKINESGLDFQVAHAIDRKGERWILRVPRRPDSMAKSKQEKMVLDIVNKYTSIEAPIWEVDAADLIAYKQLSGVPAGTVNPEIQNYDWVLDIENIPDSYFCSFGRVLADLHRVPEAALKSAGLTIYTAEQARELMKERMLKVKNDYVVQEELWNRWERWLNNDAMWPNHTGLSHGDVHPGHILINKKSEVTGLIDWTEAAVTDVSRDFIAHYLITGEAGLEKAIAAYNEAGGTTWPLMKDHIVELNCTQAIAVAEFAESSGLKEYREIAQQMLNPIQD